MESENQVTDEVCAVGQNERKLNVQELKEIANQGEVGVLVFPSVATAEQLLNSESISGKKSIHGKSNIKAAAQATARDEELLLFDPP